MSQEERNMYYLSCGIVNAIHVVCQIKAIVMDYEICQV
jgi:hypothetical protein